MPTPRPPLADELTTDELEGLQLSERMVYAVVRCSGPCTQATIRRATDLSPGAISEALSELRDREVIRSDPTRERYSHAQHQIDPDFFA